MNDDRSPADDITALRAHLFEALRSVRSGALELDRARAINDIAKTLVDSARVEVDFIRATDGDGSGFLQPARTTALPTGITGVVRHRLRG